MALGEDVLKVMRNINVGLAASPGPPRPTAGNVPTILWPSPSAHVTQDAFERIRQGDGRRHRRRRALDAVYLDLHGRDGEPNISTTAKAKSSARVRKVIGDIPLRQLDLHANVTPEMVDHADALIGLPHLSSYRHGGEPAARPRTSRAIAEHQAALRQGLPSVLPFLIPISWQCTNDQPTKGIYEELAAVGERRSADAVFRAGFPAADFEGFCGPSGYLPMAGQRPRRTRRRTRSRHWSQAMKTISTVASMRPTRACAMRWSFPNRRKSRSSSADTQDNPGAVAIPTPPACCAHWCATRPVPPPAVIYDPQSPRPRMTQASARVSRWRSAARSGSGRRALSGDLRRRETLRWKVRRAGPIWRPATWTWGRRRRCGSAMSAWSSAHTRHSCRPVDVRYVGIEPTEQAILVNKSLVHFRADFEPIAEKLLICAHPAQNAGRSRDVAWKAIASWHPHSSERPVFNPRNLVHTTTGQTKCPDRPHRRFRRRTHPIAATCTRIPEIGSEEVRTSGIGSPRS